MSGSGSQPPNEIGTLPGRVTRKRRKVTRTRSGCLTCRQRRKACDMAKPECGACLRLKKECCWPDLSSSIRRSATRKSTSTTRSPSAMSVPSAAGSHHYSDNSGSGWGGSVANLNGTFGSAVNVEFYSAFPSNIGLDASFTALTDPHISDLSGQPTSQPVGPVSRAVGPSQGDNLLQDLDLDESLLQAWAANCLNAPGSQDPFQSLSELLGLGPTYSDVTYPMATRDNTPPQRQHVPLLHHYQRSLSKLVSCTTEGSPSSFAAFTQLATAQSSSRVGKGLHLGILAWAGRHMTNEGEIKYEALSERLGEEATKIVTEQVVQWEHGSMATEETTRLTLLGGLLMLIQWKICRGDVWGYESIVQHLKSLADSLFTPTSPGVAPDSMSFSFFENLLYHDILSVRAYTKGPIIPYSILLSYSGTAVDSLNTLTGACLPLFIRMHRIADLTKKTRLRYRWDDETLVDTMTEAERLEEELKEEKLRMDSMVRNRADLSFHRYLHEAFRIACLLSLYAFVHRTPPSALQIRLLVRQALSLLEQMRDQKLPGYCSSHWIIFVTALCSTKSGAGKGELEDSQRIEQVYKDFENHWAFKNIPRSRRIAQEVRSRNDEGRRYVDWIHVVEEYEWELWLV